MYRENQKRNNELVLDLDQHQGEEGGKEGRGKERKGGKK